MGNIGNRQADIIINKNFCPPGEHKTAASKYMLDRRYDVSLDNTNRNKKLDAIRKTAIQNYYQNGIMRKCSREQQKIEEEE